MKNSVPGRFGILLILFVSALINAAPVSAQAPDPGLLNNLLGNARVQVPEAVMDKFLSGAGEADVIVVLKPSGQANELAVRSRASAKVPDSFEAPGAPPFYDLKDRNIRQQLRTTVTETVTSAIGRLAGQGLRIKQRFTYQFGFAAAVTPAALARIVNDPQVLAVENDGILQAHLAQGVPLMNATASRASYGGAGLSIAICDTGIDTAHPKLGNGGFPNTKVVGGYDFGDDDPDPRPNSSAGNAHGTACAGIAAGDPGATGDYIGGVAPDAKLYALKISIGDSGLATYSAIIAAWNWAVDHQDDDPDNPIMIISTSFGGGRYLASCDSLSPSMTAAAANVLSAGITNFVSSGNDGYCDSIGFPACVSYVNSVGAVYDASMGTYGFCVNANSCAEIVAEGSCTTGYAAWDLTASDKVTSYSNSASFLTLLAPSHDAYTTDIVGTGGYAAGDYDTGFGGTSAACPYTAGAAAVLQSAALSRTGSFLTPAEVRQYLVDNGDSVTDTKNLIATPRVNLDNAVAALPATYELTVSKAGTGSGTVTSSPVGINCGSDCIQSYIENTPVTLTPTPDPGDKFIGWAGDADCGDGEVTMTADISCTGVFDGFPWPIFLPALMHDRN